ncbi:MAG: tRNA (adenosine(37)-N6)-dimethylallyltransferase MiaA [Halioglobus sp.]
MASTAKPPLICLMGPTASGKTDLAIELVASLNCELISVDSALVYRGLDIGSAKPDYPHHLVDIRDPAEIYSAADFMADANRLADDITARGKIPLLVGGTMLYFKAFLEGLADMPSADLALRAAIEEEAGIKGWPHIHAQLADVDPESAARIHPNHSQRLGRALEVYRSSGITLTEWQARQGGQPLPADRYRVLQLAICPQDRAELHRRIALRYEGMLAAGFLAEVAALRARGDLDPDLPALRAVGYRQMWQHLNGDYSLEEAVDKGVAATRQLAKRQLTWLRKWPDLQWIYTDPAGNVLKSTLSDPVGEAAGQKPAALALKWLACASIK